MFSSQAFSATAGAPILLFPLSRQDCSLMCLLKKWGKSDVSVNSLEAILCEGWPEAEFCSKAMEL